MDLKEASPSEWHLQKAGPSERSFDGGLPLQMIICERPAHPDDHFQDVNPSRWSFAFVVCHCLSFFVVVCHSPFVVVFRLLLFAVCHCLLFVAAVRFNETVFHRFNLFLRKTEDISYGQRKLSTVVSWWNGNGGLSALGWTWPIILHVSNKNIKVCSRWWRPTF